MPPRATEDRRSSQYECSTSYVLPGNSAHRRCTASVELVFELTYPSDQKSRSLRVPGAFAALCFAALAPSTEKRTAGRSVLGVRLSMHIAIHTKSLVVIELTGRPSSHLQGSRNAHSHLDLLPVGSHLGGRQQRYVWDGQAIKVIDTEELAFKQTKRQHLLAQLRDWSESVKAAFMPEKDLVTPDYWAYSFWRNSHRFFSSAITVFATQVCTLTASSPIPTLRQWQIFEHHLNASMTGCEHGQWLRAWQHPRI